MTPGGVLTTIYDFCSQANCSDGPAGSLVQATKGSYFYGTTGGGGAGGQSTIFRINSANKLTTLHSFSGGDGGGNPVSGLVEASDGRFYGTTELGGTSSNCYFNFNDGCGTIFKIEITIAGSPTQFGCTVEPSVRGLDQPGHRVSATITPTKTVKRR